MQPDNEHLIFGKLGIVGLTRIIERRARLHKPTRGLRRQLELMVVAELSR